MWIRCSPPSLATNTREVWAESVCPQQGSHVVTSDSRGLGQYLQEAHHEYEHGSAARGSHSRNEVRTAQSRQGPMGSDEEIVQRGWVRREARRSGQLQRACIRTYARASRNTGTLYSPAHQPVRSRRPYTDKSKSQCCEGKKIDTNANLPFSTFGASNQSTPRALDLLRWARHKGRGSRGAAGHLQRLRGEVRWHTRSE